MNNSSAKLNPFLRFLAAGTLLIWLAAVTACSTECFGEDSHSDTEKMGQIVVTGGQSHDSDNHDNHDDSLCVSLHSVCPTTPSTALTKPDFGMVFTLDFISTAQLVALAQAETPVSRQPPDDELVFKPVVCHDPAFRSQAPPFLV